MSLSEIVAVLSELGGAPKYLPQLTKLILIASECRSPLDPGWISGLVTWLGKATLPALETIVLRAASCDSDLTIDAQLLAMVLRPGPKFGGVKHLEVIGIYVVNNGGRTVGNVLDGVVQSYAWSPFRPLDRPVGA